MLVRSDEKKMSLDGFKCPKLIVVDCPHEALAGGYELSPVDFDGCPVYWSRQSRDAYNREQHIIRARRPLSTV